jgi:hypothetical protein
MATPIFACGAECGVRLATGPHWASQAGTVSFDTGTVRSGLRSVRSNPTTATGYFTSLAQASSTDWVIRLYVRFTTLPSASCAIVILATSGLGVYYKSSDSKLYAGSNTTNLGASGVAVTTGQWYRVDFKATSTTADASIDGTAVGQLAGSFSANTQFAVGVSTANATADLFIDDILISQTTADYPIGAGFVKSYIPNADGTHNLVGGANDFERTLTNVAITNSTTDAYDLINERPLPTTEVEFINAVAPPTTDWVEWEYEDSTEADPPRAVEALLIHHDAGGAGTNDWSVILRYGGSSSPIWTGTTNVGSTITAKRTIFPTVPGTGGDAWTTTAFNALRSRFTVTDAAPDVYLDAAMLEAEFPEAVAAVARVPRSTSYPQLLAH